MNRKIILNSNCVSPINKKYSVPLNLINLGIDAVKASNARWNPNPAGCVDNRYILQLRLNRMCNREKKTIFMMYPIMPNYKICLIVNDLWIPSGNPVIFEVIQNHFKSLSAHNMEYIKHALTLSQLIEHFETAESKKVLMESYDLFLIPDDLGCYIYNNMGVNFYKKCQGINFKNHGRTENLIRRMFPSVIRGGENTNIVNIEMATENMPNRKFSGNVIAMLQRLGSLLDDNFENVLHSIHLMPEGYPSLSFPLFFMSNFLNKEINLIEICEPTRKYPKRSSKIETKNKSK